MDDVEQLSQEDLATLVSYFELLNEIDQKQSKE
jgi:hypothetical protein